MGGRIALHLAAYRPDAIRRAVSVDPPVSGPGRRRYPTTLEMFQNSRRQIETRAVQGVLDSVRYPYPLPPGQPELRAKYTPMASLNAVMESWFGFHLEDVHALVPQLRVPTLLAWADQGVILAGEAQELAQLNPELRVVKVASAGHLVPWDNWPDLHRAIDDFLHE